MIALTSNIMTITTTTNTKSGVISAISKKKAHDGSCRSWAHLFVELWSSADLGEIFHCE